MLIPYSAFSSPVKYAMLGSGTIKLFLLLDGYSLMWPYRFFFSFSLGREKKGPDPTIVLTHHKATSQVCNPCAFKLHCNKNTTAEQ